MQALVYLTNPWGQTAPRRVKTSRTRASRLGDEINTKLREYAGKESSRGQGMDSDVF